MNTLVLDTTVPPRPSLSASTSGAVSPKAFGVTPTIKYIPRMTYTGYYLCCGASIFANFSAIYPVTKEITNAEVKAAIERAKVAHHGLITAIITKTQLANNRFLHDAMVEHGFIPVARAGNPNHGNITNIILYVAVVGGGKAGILGTSDIEDCLTTADAKDIVTAGTLPL